MGNKSCTLGVQTEKSVYFSGETVNGRIYLSVNIPEGIVAQSLNLHCSGIERGVVHYTEERESNRSEDRSEDRYESREFEIVNFDIPIHTPVGSLYQQGQYEFPFNFVLPQNLPSSMFCRQWQSKCEVRYEMKAYLAKNDRSSSFMNPFHSNTISSKSLPLNIFGSNNINNNIHGNLYHTNQPVHFPGETHRVRNCCCCYRGQMSLRASLDNGIFIPNNSRSLSFDLSNSSRAKVDNVTVELIERVTWKPQFREEAHEFTLFKNVIETSSSGNRDWMSTEQRVEETIQEYVALSPTSGGGGVGPRGGVGGQVVHIATPNNARDSYSGRMIQVEHFVRVRVYTNGCCVSNPESTADIIVTRPLEAFLGPVGNTNHNDQGIQTQPPPLPSAPFMDDEDEPIVEATVLPPDWSPLTSDTITIPVADVVSITPGEYNGNEQQYSRPTALRPSAQK